jgi:hypothetical protein
MVRDFHVAESEEKVSPSPTVPGAFHFPLVVAAAR